MSWLPWDWDTLNVDGSFVATTVVTRQSLYDRWIVQLPCHQGWPNKVYGHVRNSKMEALTQ
jgi:hypothetical protein